MPLVFIPSAISRLISNSSSWSSWRDELYAIRRPGHRAYALRCCSSQGPDDININSNRYSGKKKEHNTTAAASIATAEVLRARLEYAASQRRLSEIRSLRRDIDDRRRLRLAAHPPYATISLIALTSFLYAVGICNAALRLKLLGTWSCGGLPLLAHEPWRMYFSCFLHRNFSHFATNIAILAALGTATEVVYGIVPFLTLYFMGTVFGALFSAFVRTTSIRTMSITIGASGSLHALVGALLVHLQANRKPLGIRAATTTFIALVAALVVTVVSAFFAVKVDAAAHMGGLIAGAVLGMVLVPSFERFGNIAIVRRFPPWKAAVLAIALSICTVFALLFVPFVP